jgi:hypothetical protein
MFGVHFTTLEIVRGASGLLKYFFGMLAEPFVGRGGAAAGADRDLMAAAREAAGPIVPEVVVEKVAQQAAITAK